MNTSKYEPWMCNEGLLLFNEELKKSKSYLEYGSGNSTLYALTKSPVNQIISVDSDLEWVKKINVEVDLHINLFPQKNVNLIHCDVGLVGEWGEPVGFDGFQSYWSYANLPWMKVIELKLTKPDLILVDGRFRVACFLVSIINADANTSILFDDYLERSEYHLVEKYAYLEKISGRMALFKVGKNINLHEICIDLMRYSTVSA